MFLTRRYFVLLLLFLPFLVLLPWRWWQKIVPAATLLPDDKLKKNEEYLHILGHSYQAITANQQQSKTKEAMLFMHEFLKTLPNWSVQELKLGLMLLEKVLPLLCGHLAPFSALSFEKKSAVMQWLKQAPAILYPLFMGLKELSYLAHYRLDQNWEFIDYAGPLVERSYDNPDFNREYDVLLAEKFQAPKGQL